MTTVLASAGVANGLSSVSTVGSQVGGIDVKSQPVSGYSASVDGGRIALISAPSPTGVELPVGSVDGGRVRRLGPVEPWLAETIERAQLQRLADADNRQAVTNNRMKGRP